jgi:hypothetical protein
MLRIPHCLDNRLTVNYEILATCSSTYSPVRTSQEAHSVLYSVSCEVGTEFMCYVEENWPLLWSSGQSSWLQIQRSEFNSGNYQIFWEVVDLQWGPLSLVNTSEELLERKSSWSGREIREYDCRDQSRWPHGTLYPYKLALTSPTSGGRSVGIVRSRDVASDYTLSCTESYIHILLSSTAVFQELLKLLMLKILWCVSLKVRKQKTKRWSFSSNRPWRSIRLWNIEDPTLSRQSAYRWR